MVLAVVLIVGGVLISNDIFSLPEPTMTELAGLIWVASGLIVLQININRN